MKILPTGVAEAGAWNYAFIYDLVSRWFPKLDAQARPWTTAAARRKIVLQHLDNLAVASEGEVRSLLGWPAAVLARTLAALTEGGDVEKVEVVDGERTTVRIATRAGARRLRREVRARRSARTSRGKTTVRRRRVA
jgi:uncharacterized protein YcaQ